MDHASQDPSRVSRKLQAGIILRSLLVEKNAYACSICFVAFFFFFFFFTLLLRFLHTLTYAVLFSLYFIIITVYACVSCVCLLVLSLSLSSLASQFHFLILAHLFLLSVVFTRVEI